MDTNQNYCQRLAEVLCDQIAAGVVRPFNISNEVMQLYPQLKIPIDPNALCANLQTNPKIQAKLAVISEYTPSKWLLERELEARGFWTRPANGPAPDAYDVAGKNPAFGLCFSGGGIRSATFNLGIMQGLARYQRLKKFHYLSSVSGGGYIHQFLAAWIYNRTPAAGVVKASTPLDEIQNFLNPVPNDPPASTFPGNHTFTVVSEPLRWLRRYTNYLAPRTGLTSLDTWTIIATWLRNTTLNLVVLLSGFVSILLLPHFVLTYKVLSWAWTFHGQNLHSVFAFLILAAFAVSAFFFRKWICECIDSAHQGPRFPRILWCLLALFAASLVLAPSVYRSSIPGELSHYDGKLNPAFAPLPDAPSHLHYSAQFEDTASPNANTFKIDADSKSPEPVSRLKAHWGKYPKSFVVLFLQHPHLPRHCWPSGYPLTLIPLFFILGNAILMLALGSSADCLPKWALALLFGVGGGFAWLLLFGIRFLFFFAAFAPPPELISALGVALLPPLLFAVPFITLELGIGLIGNRMQDEHREWIARLRAASFLTGSLWLIVTGFSLLGPTVYDWIASLVVAKYAVWGGWLATTVGGVLAGNSSKTASKSSVDTGTATKSTAALELLARIAPYIFIAGLQVLLAKLVYSSTATLDFGTLCLVLASSVFVFIAYGRRIDVNDFSMHSFYRDRIARCYAGASKIDRKPNRFTGFASSDRDLPVSALLPNSWKPLNGMVGAGVNGSYDGPFPIICTSINLTTGEDLAYQERKAASFAFTPLFTGFNVGWTSGSDNTNQFNGFVPTQEYVYVDQKYLAAKRPTGVSLATAVAISGAAASPNMGYHTNPAIAFLLTVFNVRLGWWLRNPRHRGSGSKPHSSPVFGPSRLFDELHGAADDTQKYIYLTDGGHFENMGLYELVRRRCRTIVVCDAEEDAQLVFEGIAMAIRKVRLDFGVEIALSGLGPVAPAPAPPPAPIIASLNLTASAFGMSPGGITGQIYGQRQPPNSPQTLATFADYPRNTTHAVIGTITYPEDPGNPGNILYIKSSLTGDESADILNFRREHPAFPNDETINQFFTESQFESYRRLGQHIVETDPAVLQWLTKYL